jgi:hypothetical protein
LTGLNLKILETYDVRDQEIENEEGLPKKHREKEKDAMIYSLSLQVKTLEKRLQKTQRRKHISSFHGDWMKQYYN